MIDVERTTSSRYRLLVLVLVIMALSVLSFHGALDNFANERVIETTRESVGIYAVSRTINAGVSVLQTAQVKVPLLASLQLGEVLDPLNDGIERLSATVVWAIGSLFVQRIVLDIASSTFFRWIFLGFGLIALLAVLSLVSTHLRDLTCRISGISTLALGKFCRGLVRIFVIVAVLRFIIPTFVGFSFLVSDTLLQSELDRDRNELTVMSREVSINAGTSSLVVPGFIEQRSEKMRELATLQETRAGHEKQFDDVHSEIGVLNEEAGLERFVPEMLGGPSVDQNINLLREKRENLLDLVDDVAQQIKTVRNELECIDRRIEGKTCGSLLGRLSDASKAGIENVTKIADTANNLVVLIANVLIALFVKNILFPILFLFVAMKFGRYIVKHAMNLKLNLQEELVENGSEMQQIERV